MNKADAEAQLNDLDLTPHEHQPQKLARVLLAVMGEVDSLRARIEQLEADRDA